MDKTQAILLLDDNSKRIVKTNITDLSLHNILFVNNLGEITDDMISSTKNVIVLEGFLRGSTGLSDLRLYKALQELQYFYIGQDEVLIKEASSVAHVFHANIATLNYDIISAALYRDISLEEVNVDFVGDSVAFARAICKNNNEFDKKFVELAQEFLAAESCITKLQKELKSEHKKVIRLEANNEKINNENEMLTGSYAEMLAKAHELNLNLQEYEHILTKDIYDKLKLHNYPNRPQIIYLKEYEELNHLYSLINTLFEVFRIQGKNSVKVLQLLDSTKCNRAKVLPEYFTLIENGYLLKDVITNDFICKIGDYSRILDTLLTNRASLDVLIIVDCKDYNDTVIGGSFLQFNMCRNVKHLENYGLIPENTIVNNSDNDLFLSWDHYVNYNDFEDNDEKFLFLSSQPIIQKILELSQIFQESV